MARSLALVLLVACGPEGTDSATAPGPTPGGGWAEDGWCEDMADLSDLAASHGPARLRETVLELSRLRYPPAVGFVEAQTDAELERWFFAGTGTLDDVLQGYEVAVHEGCHIWGFDSFSFHSYAYRVVDDSLVVETAFLQNFDRSEILSRHPYPNDDFYADTYLTGQSGAQGFNTLLDEFNAYTHSLASRYCTRDSIQGATSARDGILTFMMYVELYLQIAREEHPGDYDAIVADAPTVEVILSVWDRAEHWLAKSEGSAELGIDDERIETHVREPARLDEIERLR